MFLLIKPRYSGADYFEVEEFSTQRELSDRILEKGIPEGAFLAQPISLQVSVVAFEQPSCGFCHVVLPATYSATHPNRRGLCNVCYDGGLRRDKNGALFEPSACGSCNKPVPLGDNWDGLCWDCYKVEQARQKEQRPPHLEAEAAPESLNQAVS